MLVHCGDCHDVMRRLADDGVLFDAIVTDPPYELGFMGKKWDKSGVAFDSETWKLALAILKPGGHLLAFSGTRTYHRMASAIEDAGFEIRDQVGWTFGSGFPKSHNVGNGWGTALKPAWEPICLARKPLSEGTVAANVLRWSTGALNIDASRIGSDGGTKGCDAGPSNGILGDGLNGSFGKPVPGLGRWPANLIHDGSDEVIAAFPETNGGSAARFFYVSKASKKDRDDGLEGMALKPDGGMSGRNDGSMGSVTMSRNVHPTVKPTALMRYLCRLVTPPGGSVFDPFTGSGSTGRGAVLEGFTFQGAELSEEYAAIARLRIKAATEAAAKPDDTKLDLFAA